MRRLEKQLAIACAISGFTLPVKAAEKPHVIVILTDDMGIGDLGCYGGRFAPTPNIDKLAEEGTLYSQYYSASPISSPSRVGLFTGMEPARWNITSFLQTRAGNRKCEQYDFLNPEAPTMAKVFKENGYATGHFGKWHMGGGRDVHNAPSIHSYGFDEYISTYESPDPDPDITSTDWIWAGSDKVKRHERTAYFVDKTLEFLSRNKETPCFINLWPDDVHTPWVPSDERLRDYPATPEERSKFKAVLDDYDRQIGRLLQGLKDLGIDDNTLIIFTSDNGPDPLQQDDRSGRYRGIKMSLHEGGIRMPFIVRWPGKAPAGKRENSVVTAVDLLPTLSELIGNDISDDPRFSGESRLSVLLGTPSDKKKAIFWEYGRNKTSFYYPPRETDKSPNCAIREGKWKLLINADGTDMQLYDIENDPEESNEVSDANPDVAQALKKRLSDWRNNLPKYNPGQERDQ